MRLSQRGDTLIEVIMGISIMSVLLVTAFAVSALSFRIGQQAKERTQAVNLLQEQAEGLHNFRDSRSWSDFKTAVTNPGVGGGLAPSGLGFHMEHENFAGGKRWRMINSPNPYRPSLAGTTTIYDVNIIASNVSPVDSDKLRFDIHVTWGSNTGGDKNRTVLTTYLVNIDGLRPSDCSVGC